MKINQFFLLFAIFGSAVAYAPYSNRFFAARPSAMRMTDEASEPAGAIVPIKDETVQFTAGILGGVAGLSLGGPVLGAITAAAANYGSKQNEDVGEIVQGVSKTTIEVVNYLLKLDSKYEVLTKAKTSLEAALDKLKENDNVDPATVKKVEESLSNVTTKIKELNDDYDLVGTGLTTLGTLGDLVEKAVVQVGQWNEEFKLTDKAIEAIKTAVEKAKEQVPDQIKEPTKVVNEPTKVVNEPAKEEPVSSE